MLKSRSKKFIINDNKIENIIEKKKSPKPLLPPCRVCGDKASGLHYGLNTCEACKSFFRRSINSNLIPKCPKGGYCKILQGSKRNTCSHCRYQKCLDLGMSKDQIQAGRYNAIRRKENVEEVKRLEREEKARNSFDSNICLSNNEMDNVIQTLSNKFDEITKDRKRNNLCPLGSLNKMLKLPKEKQQKFALEVMVPMKDRELKRAIAFAKTVPGFKNLCLNDQAELIKFNRVELQILHEPPAPSDTETECIFSGNKVTVDALTTILESREIAEKFLKLARFHSYGFKHTNVLAIILAITCLSTDRCVKLENRKAIEILHDNIMNIAQYLFKKRGLDSSKMIKQTTEFLYEARIVSNHIISLEHGLLKKYPEFPWPKLVKEVWYNEVEDELEKLSLNTNICLEKCLYCDNDNVLNTVSVLKNKLLKTKNVVRHIGGKNISNENLYDDHNSQMVELPVDILDEFFDKVNEIPENQISKELTDTFTSLINPVVSPPELDDLLFNYPLSPHDMNIVEDLENLLNDINIPEDIISCL